MIRPWRVGILTDVTSVAKVRSAIAKLSSVWGGQFMPILDAGSSPADIERMATLFDVDALFAETEQGPANDFLQESEWSWGFGREWGPFGRGEYRFRKGLLPARAFIDTGTDFVQPRWDPKDPCDLVYSAIWGLGHRVGVAFRDGTATNEGPRRANLDRALQEIDQPGRITGAVNATAIHVSARERRYLDDLGGIFLIRPDSVSDVVTFWNMRSFGVDLLGVPSISQPGITSELLRGHLPHSIVQSDEADAIFDIRVPVWGYGVASELVAQEIQDTVTGRGMVVSARNWADDWPHFVFQGLETQFSRTIRVDFRPNAQWVDVDLPRLPLDLGPGAIEHGVVAAEIDIRRVSGQDPRYASISPPYRRHSALLSYATRNDGIDHARISRSGGQVLGIDARRDSGRFCFVSNLEAFRLLFDDESVTVNKSDVGKFQTRAAEKFGGLYSGVFNQPGVRQAVLDAHSKGGVPLERLRQAIEKGKGSWPDPIYERLSDQDYVTRELNRLLDSGIFVPVLRVHCSHCRVESWITADDIAAKMRCEFCAESFNLALSHSLARPSWRYRFASHLRPDQVQALLPPLAVSSLVSQLRHIEEPPLPHVLGLEVKNGKKQVEVDVAMYIPDPCWLVIIGEVKSANRVDENDIRNIEGVCASLRTAGVRSVPLFATLKDRFSDDEVSSLRRLVERSSYAKSSRGVSLPNVPLVLTGPDLSQPSGAPSHPWRWEDETYSGILGTAVSSCERNIGLKSFATGPGGSIKYEWEQD